MFTETAYAIASPNLAKLRFGTHLIFWQTAEQDDSHLRFLHNIMLDICRQPQPSETEFSLKNREEAAQVKRTRAGKK